MTHADIAFLSATIWAAAAVGNARFSFAMAGLWCGVGVILVAAS